MSATWERSLKCLARGGRPDLWRHHWLQGRHRSAVSVFQIASLMGSHGHEGRVAPRRAHFFFSGDVRPIVDRTFPLSAAAAQHLEAGKQFGKVVLEESAARKWSGQRARYRYFNNPRSAGRWWSRGSDQRRHFPHRRIPATVTGSVSTSHTVAPAMTMASTPTSPITRLSSCREHRCVGRG